MIHIIFNSSTYSIWLISFKCSVMTFIFVILKRSHMSVSFYLLCPINLIAPKDTNLLSFGISFFRNLYFIIMICFVGFLWLVSLTFSQLLRIFIHSFLWVHNIWLLLHVSKVVCLDCFYFLSSTNNITLRTIYHFLCVYVCVQKYLIWLSFPFWVYFMVKQETLPFLIKLLCIKINVMVY